MARVSVMNVSGFMVARKLASANWELETWHLANEVWPYISRPVIEYPQWVGCGRSIDLGSNKTMEKSGRHAQISNNARTVDRVHQTQMTQGSSLCRCRCCEGYLGLSGQLHRRQLT
jgi:hypothetical protein